MTRPKDTTITISFHQHDADRANEPIEVSVIGVGPRMETTKVSRAKLVGYVTGQLERAIRQAIAVGTGVEFPLIGEERGPERG